MFKNKIGPVRDITAIEKEIATTPEQMKIWNVCHSGERFVNGGDNGLIAISLQGDLSVKILQEAFLKVIEKHYGMRSLVSPDGKNLIIIKNYSVPIRMRDIREMSVKEKEVFLKKHLQQKGPYNFNLVNGPLYVLDLIQLKKENYLLTLTGHELIFYEKYLELIISELGAMYSELVLSKSPWLSKKDFPSEDSDLQGFVFLTRKSYTNQLEESLQILLASQATMFEKHLDNTTGQEAFHRSEYSLDKNGKPNISNY